MTQSAKPLFRALKRQDKPQEARRADDFYPTGQPEAIRALLARDGARILPLRNAWFVWDRAWAGPEPAFRWLDKADNRQAEMAL